MAALAAMNGWGNWALVEVRDSGFAGGRPSRGRGWLAGACVLAAICQSAVAVEPKVVTFPATDGVRLSADYFAPPVAGTKPAPMVVLLHMYRSDRHAWRPLIAPLHEAGFAVLALDLRGHGDSATTETREQVTRRDTEIFRNMQHDVRGAYDWLVQQPGVDRARFALVGASVGCSVALQYAAKDRSVDAIVCLSPGLNYLGLDSGGDIGQIAGRHILLLACGEERDAPYTLQKRAPETKVEIDRDHQAHGTEMFGAVPELERRIVEFLRAGVGEYSATTVFGSIESNVYHPQDSGWIGRINATNLRYYSSPAEAEARGLRASRSASPDSRPADRPAEAPPGRSRP